MNNKFNQLMCAHAALIPVFFLGAFFFIPGWFPPPSPDLPAEAVKLHFEENSVAIRIGMMVTALSGVFWWPFSSAIAGQMKRMESGTDHVLARLQMAAGLCAGILIIFCAYFVLAAAYRPYTPATTLIVFYDFAWLMFIGCFPVALIQDLALGICILRNKSGVDVYPRWMGYANVFFAISTIPAGLIGFFYSGPFSWNGIISFWMAGICFFLWIIFNWIYTVKAIKNQPD